MKRPYQERKVYWKAYKGIKCMWNTFYSRMIDGNYPMDVAIKETLPNRTSIAFKKSTERRLINHKQANDNKYNPSHYEIGIRYPLQEERDIFKRAYLREIEKAESIYVDTPLEEIEKNKKIEKLTKEYNNFLQLNTESCEIL